jgi:hypothetical protein
MIFSDTTGSYTRLTDRLPKTIDLIMMQVFNIFAFTSIKIG